MFSLFHIFGYKYSLSGSNVVLGVCECQNQCLQIEDLACRLLIVDSVSRFKLVDSSLQNQ